VPDLGGVAGRPVLCAVIIATRNNLVYRHVVVKDAQNLADRPSGLGLFRRRRRRGGFAGRRGVAAMEFAIITIPFLAFVFFVIEVGYDLFTQEALDAGLNQAVKQLARGNAQNVQDSASFVSSYLCPDLRGLLECDTHLYIKVQRFPPKGAKDYYDIVDGKPTISGNSLDLSAYQAKGSFCNVERRAGSRNVFSLRARY